MRGRFIPAFIEIYLKSFNEPQAMEKCMWAQTELYYSLDHVYGSSIVLTHLPPGQNGRHLADDTFWCIFFKENVRSWIQISLWFVPKGPIKQASIGSDNGLATSRLQVITSTNSDPVHWRIYPALGGDELIKCTCHHIILQSLSKGAREIGHMVVSRCVYNLDCVQALLKIDVIIVSNQTAICWIPKEITNKRSYMSRRLVIRSTACNLSG